MVFGTILSKVRISKIIFFGLGLTLLSGCKGNRWEADTSGIHVDTHIKRFDKAVFTLDSNQWDVQFAALQREYPDMLELIMGPNLFRFGPVSDLKAQQRFKKIYVYDKYLRDSLFPDIQKKFPEPKIKEIENRLQEPFKRIKYFYPKDSLPQIYTFVSAYGYKVVTYKNRVLGISLDMFMGENYRYYPALEFSEYQIRKLREEYILPEVLKAIFIEKYEEGALTDNSMLSQMLYLGKQDYFAKVMAPEMNDSLLFGYTDKQAKWCVENEGQMWNHFVTKKDSRNNMLLYSNDQYELAKYLADGPYTAAQDVPPESAPRLGEWMGYRIIEKYMEENRDITLDQMMRDKDYKKILQKSKYKPKL